MAFADFFHDSETLELLIERAMPTLRGQACLHVWNPACGNGAELYTLAMLMREQMSERVFRTMRIHATDANPRLGPQIIEGIYPEQDVKRIPYPIRYRHFQITDKPGCVQVVDELRSRVSFARHDLLSLMPPHEDFSVIVCRNVLPSLDETERRQVFRMFHQAMRPGGFLATEHVQERPQSLDSLFEPISDRAQVYRRLDAPVGVRSHVDGPHAPGVRVPKELHEVRAF
jgi:chemotaxis protein methyltransferase CheR